MKLVNFILLNAVSLTTLFVGANHLKKNTTQDDVKQKELPVVEVQIEPDGGLFPENPLPKFAPYRPVDVSKNYVTTKNSGITAWRLNQHLGGVLKNKGEVFVKAGLKYGVDPLFLAALATHESGRGSSKFSKQYNNVCGLLFKDKPRKFKSVDECIFFCAERLNRYYHREGKVTVEQVGNKFCPIGVKNDPQKINRHWVPKIVTYMKQIQLAGN